jgi:hypothetical protein
MSGEALSEQAYEAAADRTLRALERAVGELGDLEADLAAASDHRVQDGVSA